MREGIGKKRVCFYPKLRSCGYKQKTGLTQPPLCGARIRIFEKKQTIEPVSLHLPTKKRILKKKPHPKQGKAFSKAGRIGLKMRAGFETTMLATTNEGELPWATCVVHRARMSCRRAEVCPIKHLREATHWLGKRLQMERPNPM